MNKAIKNNWYWFVIGAFAITGVVCGGVAIRCNPTAKEKILYYVCAMDIDTSVLVKESKSVSSEDIRQIRVNHESVKSSENSRLFGMVYNSTDIYIYPESQLERTIPLCVGFNQDNINDLLPNASAKEKYEDNGSYFAIKIYDSDSGEGALKDIIDYRISDEDKQDYYLSFPKTSKHIGLLNNCASDNALKIANHLLEL